MLVITCMRGKYHVPGKGRARSQLNRVATVCAIQSVLQTTAGTDHGDSARCWRGRHRGLHENLWELRRTVVVASSSASRRRRVGHRKRQRLAGAVVTCVHDFDAE